MDSVGYKVLEACQEQLSIVNQENNALRRKVEEQDLIIQNHSTSAKGFGYTITRKDYFIGQAMCGLLAGRCVQNIEHAYRVASNNISRILKD